MSVTTNEGVNIATALFPHCVVLKMYMSSCCSRGKLDTSFAFFMALKIDSLIDLMIFIFYLFFLF